MYLTCFFFDNIPCCFYFVIRLCYKSSVLLLLSSFVTFLMIVVYYMRFCSWIIAVLSEGIQTSVVFERYIYSFCNPVTTFSRSFCI